MFLSATVSTFKNEGGNSKNRTQTRRPAEVTTDLSNLPHKIEGLRDRDHSFKINLKQDGINGLVQTKCAYSVIADTFYWRMKGRQILQVGKNFLYSQILFSHHIFLCNHEEPHKVPLLITLSDGWFRSEAISTLNQQVYLNCDTLILVFYDLLNRKTP